MPHSSCEQNGSRAGASGGLPTRCQAADVPCGARLCGVRERSALGVEQDLAFQHGAGDAEQPVADAAEGARMAVPEGPQGGVFRLADGVAMSRHCGPVADSVLQAVVSGQPADDDQTTYVSVS